MKNKLEVGGGPFKKPGWINMDAVKIPVVDVVHNMDKFPWPFEDDKFEEITFSHVLEHSRNTHGVLNECWRTGKNGCKIKIISPYPTGSTNKADTTHYSDIWHKIFNNYSLEFYEKNKDKYIYGAVFKIKKRKFIGSFNSKILNIIMLPFIWSRMPKIYEATCLCYLFPVDGIEIELEVVKNEQIKTLKKQMYDKNVFI